MKCLDKRFSSELSRCVLHFIEFFYEMYLGTLGVYFINLTFVLFAEIFSVNTNSQFDK